MPIGRVMRGCCAAEAHDRQLARGTRSSACGGFLLGGSSATLHLLRKQGLSRSAMLIKLVYVSVLFLAFLDLVGGGADGFQAMLTALAPRLSRAHTAACHVK